MRMRTFFTTLLLFLVMVNLCIVGILAYTYADTMENARERSFASHSYIVLGLVKDLDALSRQNAQSDESLRALMPYYGNITSNQQAELQLYDGSICIYSTFTSTGNDGEVLGASANTQATSTDISTSISELPENSTRTLTSGSRSSQTYMNALGRLTQPYDNYTLVYRLNITAELAEWQNMRNIMFATGLAASLVLAIVLMLLLGKLWQPLRDISQTSGHIAAGELNTRLTVKGSDELAEMAASFNHMADAIECQMGELVTAANNKQLFIDNFAHETKTPLTAIHGYADYLQKADLSEEDRRFALDAILSQSQRLQTMVWQMMELSDMRNNALHMEDVRVSELFEKVEHALGGTAATLGVALEFRTELPTLLGDVGLLESLLINLVDNAIKASSAGSTVAVSAFVQDGLPVLTVIDHGKGIPAESLTQITQPYYRVDKHRHRRDGGAGLGLAICEQIAEAHHAKLEFDSKLGAGTTATVTFTTLQ